MKKYRLSLSFIVLTLSTLVALVLFQQKKGVNPEQGVDPQTSTLEANLKSPYPTWIGNEGLFFTECQFN